MHTNILFTLQAALFSSAVLGKKLYISSHQTLFKKLILINSCVKQVKQDSLQNRDLKIQSFLHFVYLLLSQHPCLIYNTFNVDFSPGFLNSQIRSFHEYKMTSLLRMNIFRPLSFYAYMTREKMAFSSPCLPSCFA